MAGPPGGSTSRALRTTDGSGHDIGPGRVAVRNLRGPGAPSISALVLAGDVGAAAETCLGSAPDDPVRAEQRRDVIGACTPGLATHGSVRSVDGFIEHGEAASIAALTFAPISQFRSWTF